MNLESAKLLYVLSCIVLGLIIISPVLFSVFPFPEGEGFSELWLLGANNNIKSGTVVVSAGKSYTFYLGVANHMSGLEYYKVYVKFRNQSEPLPDRTTGLPSPLRPVFEYSLFLSNNKNVEEEFSFSFKDLSFEKTVSRVSVLSINGRDVVVDKMAVWDEASNGFYFQLFFELWLYNSTTSNFQFHNRYVSLWLKLDVSK